MYKQKLLRYQRLSLANNSLALTRNSRSGSKLQVPVTESHRRFENAAKIIMSESGVRRGHRVIPVLDKKTRKVPSVNEISNRKSEDIFPPAIIRSNCDSLATTRSDKSLNETRSEIWYTRKCDEVFFRRFSITLGILLTVIGVTYFAHRHVVTVRWPLKLLIEREPFVEKAAQICAIYSAITIVIGYWAMSGATVFTNHVLKQLFLRGFIIAIPMMFPVIRLSDFLIYADEVTDIGDKLKGMIRNYTPDNYTQNITVETIPKGNVTSIGNIEHIQMYLRCCGVSDGLINNDWTQDIKRDTAKHGVVPWSCCKKVGGNTTKDYPETNTTRMVECMKYPTESNSFIHDGCQRKLFEFYHVIGVRSIALNIVTCIFILVVSICAFKLWITYRKLENTRFKYTVRDFFCDFFFISCFFCCKCKKRNKVEPQESDFVAVLQKNEEQDDKVQNMVSTDEYTPVQSDVKLG